MAQWTASQLRAPSLTFAAVAPLGQAAGAAAPAGEPFAPLKWPHRPELCAHSAGHPLRVPELLLPEAALGQKVAVGLPAQFIGEEALPVMVQSIFGSLPVVDDRKPPFAVIRCSRSGKTRLLQELTNRLRAARVVAICISFNGEVTPLVKSEQFDVHTALLRRVSFAIRAEGSLDWAGCGAADVDVFLAACALPVVLLVDEINAIFKPAGEQQLNDADKLWLWLKSRFLIANRQLIFSSHANDTYDQVTRISWSRTHGGLLRCWRPR